VSTNRETPDRSPLFSTCHHSIPRHDTGQPKLPTSKVKQCYNFKRYVFLLFHSHIVYIVCSCDVFLFSSLAYFFIHTCSCRRRAIRSIESRSGESHDTSGANNLHRHHNGSWIRRRTYCDRCSPGGSKTLYRLRSVSIPCSFFSKSSLFIGSAGLCRD